MFVSGQTEAEYYHVLTKKKIFKHSKYKEIKNSLGLAEYTQVDSVETINQFCVKGGIIDVYSPLYSSPVRLCLYDEEYSKKKFLITNYSSV